MPNIRKTTEYFTQKARQVHGDRYDYARSIYTVSANKLIITCPKHGDFEQKASAHMRGAGCWKCRAEEQGVRQKSRPSVYPKMTQEQFIARCREKHGDRYDYSKAIYKSWQGDKACFVCREHGEFWQMPSSHIGGMGCKKCAICALSKKRSAIAEKRLVDICKKATIYGEYTYDKVVYVDQKTPIIVTCVKHGDFEVLPILHKEGRGCRVCSAEFKSERSRAQMLKQGIEEFLKRSRERFGDKFEYDMSQYNGWTGSEIPITCRKHGNTFMSTPDAHLRRGMCDDCKRDLLREVSMSIDRCRKIHGDKYDYSEVEYVNCHTKIKIICKKCGPWMTTPSAHIHAEAGCPTCCESKGERAIALWLSDNGIDFEREWKPAGGVYGRRFLYDFFAGEVLIEFDGIQHSEAVDIFGGEEGLRRNQESDAIKTKWAEENGIQLVRIDYRDAGRIGDILSATFSQCGVA